MTFLPPAFGPPLTKEPDDSVFNSDSGYGDVGEVSSYKQLHWFPLFDRVHRTLSGLSTRPHWYKEPNIDITFDPSNRWCWKSAVLFIGDHVTNQRIQITVVEVCNSRNGNRGKADTIVCTRDNCVFEPHKCLSTARWCEQSQCTSEQVRSCHPCQWKWVPSKASGVDCTECRICNFNTF